MKNIRNHCNTVKKAAAAAAVVGHILFCVYQSLFCFYNGSLFINDLLFKFNEKLCFAVFEFSENMLLNVAPWWLVGMACTVAVIVIFIRKKAAGSVIAVCITFAAVIFIFFVSGNGYSFPDLPYGFIYTASGIWFLFDPVCLLLHFIKQAKK